MNKKLRDKIGAGVATGDEVQYILDHAKEHGYALPAVNVVGTNTANAVMEVAREVNSPVNIQFSNGGAHFFAGKGLDNTNQNATMRHQWFSSHPPVGKALLDTGNPSH